MGVITFKLEGDEAKAVAAFLKVVDAQKKTEDGARRMADASLGASKALNSVGASLGGELVGMATQFISVTAAVGLATSALRFFNTEKQRAAQNILKEAPLAGDLALSAGGDMVKFRALREEVDKTRRVHGLDEKEAYALHRVLATRGQEEYADFFGGFKPVTDPTKMAESALSVWQAFPKDTTGGPRAITNRLLAARQLSSKDINELASGTIAAGKLSFGVGTSDSELLAAVTALSRSVSPEDAGAMVGSLEKVLVKQKLGGKGFLRGVDALQQRIAGMSPRQATKFLSEDAAESESMVNLSDEQIKGLTHGGMKSEDVLKLFSDRGAKGLAAFRLLQMNRGDVDQALAKISKEGLDVGAGDLSERIKATITNTPELLEAQRVKIHTQRAEIAEEEHLGSREVQRTAMRLMGRELASAYKEPFYYRWARSAGSAALNILDVDPSTQGAFETGMSMAWQGAGQGWDRVWGGKPPARQTATPPAATRPAGVVNYNFHGDMYSWEFDLSKRPASRPSVEID